MSKIHFIKMHGAGNDYVVVDTTLHPIAHPAALAVAWSRRHTGIGSDGLVLLGRGDGHEADLTMRIFNADGSEGLMCGNACRCVGKYAYERGLTRQTRLGLLTASGLRVLELEVEGGRVRRVTVDMMSPALADPRLYRPVPPALPGGVFVSMGNPHYVIFVDDVGQVDVAAQGPRLERHASFPERCNIEWAQVGPDGTRMRVWERGSGMTMACGTGACATAVAAAVTGRAGRRSRIIMDGGELDVGWRESDGHVLLTGPATIVYEGDIEI